MIERWHREYEKRLERRQLERVAERILKRCALLAGISEDPEGIFRPYGSDSMREANAVVAGWMREAGMSVRLDAIGNLVGRIEGERPEAFVLGSHLDTVRDAGRYDGILGVMVAISAVEELGGVRLPFSLEVAAFADEEGTRFGTTYLGSSAFAGGFDGRLLDYEDAEGTSLAKAIWDFGGKPEALTGAALRRDLLGYFEVHIEQGPILDRENLPVAIVTGIQGQSRVQVSFTGEAGHAGTVPMNGRRDALTAASEFVLEVERTAKTHPGTVATVGEMRVSPGAANVIPASVSISLDIRHPDDAVRLGVRDLLETKLRNICETRSIRSRWEVRQESHASPMDDRLTETLLGAVVEAGYAPKKLTSGAGHDAAEMASVSPAAMLFVRCAGGVSHSPAESVEPEDVAAAVEVAGEFLKRIAGDFP